MMFIKATLRFRYLQGFFNLLYFRKGLHLKYLLFYNYRLLRFDPDCGERYKYQLNRTDF